MQLVGLVVFPEDLDGFGARLEHAHHAQRRRVRAREFVITQQRTRLVVSGADQRADLALGQFAC